MPQSLTLSERKRVANRERIAFAAASLVLANGLSGTTVEQISDSAEVGRATFFRYFNSKEAAVAEGISRQWMDLITAAVAAAPAELSASETVLAAFVQLAEGFEAIDAQVRDLAQLTRTSPALSAWTLQVYVGYETVIADLVAPRFADLRADDPRPRLLGALAMASVRIALDDWLDHGGSLPERVQSALGALTVS
ncbi:TetR family transcriptional regulator [Mycobacterium sp. MS1601]|uniref:acyl-CoA-like ligand-binding transcription factor n=1 Tax=Mycobacterium sp. MS1601 TaxID=1936029 RepID=UPI00097977C1|nr:TetR family transcriptional regulator [Mycobacterium sp. MS1601]AQA04072.1 TetR family transcriptional regulator [Mycobacterium sp. MS1601]